MAKIKTVGIVGGGQLGRMMIPYIKQLGMNVVVLDPDKNCPCASIAELVVSDFNDERGYKELDKKCDVITYEFEHINVAMLRNLKTQIFPSVESLAIIQDKYTQKKALQDAGVPVPKLGFDLKHPFIVKSRLGGYDGKGNFMEMPDDYCEEKYFQEELVDFEKEVSVIATRGQDGSIVVYPISENVHKNSILDTATIPAKVAKSVEPKVFNVAKSVMECFQGVGTFCAELFITKKGDVLVNEVAPRVHNSGHHTIEACRTSQFENHIRAICGLPLGSAKMVVPYAVTKNIIGEHFTDLAGAMGHDGVNVHLYGKTEAKAGRKMGHITITGDEEHVKKVCSIRKW